MHAITTLTVYKHLTTGIDYHQTSDISCALVGNKFVDHSDVYSWSIAYRRCSNCIFILLTPGFNILYKANWKTRRVTFKFGGLVRLILEIWRCMRFGNVWIIQCQTVAEVRMWMYHYNTSISHFGLMSIFGPPHVTFQPFHGKKQQRGSLVYFELLEFAAVEIQFECSKCGKLVNKLIQMCHEICAICCSGNWLNEIKWK